MTLLLIRQLRVSSQNDTEVFLHFQNWLHNLIDSINSDEYGRRRMPQWRWDKFNLEMETFYWILNEMNKNVCKPARVTAYWLIDTEKLLKLLVAVLWFEWWSFNCSIQYFMEWMFAWNSIELIPCSKDEFNYFMINCQ